MSLIRCPTCNASFDSEQSEAMPFCSDRCRQIDLGRWLDEKYSVPYERLDDEDDIEAGDDGNR